MRIHFGADHAALELKEAMVAHVRSLGHEPVDHGAFSYDAEDDYPSFVIPAAQAVVAEPDSLGIVLGGSGNGEQMAANKVKGVRAALAYSTETAELARRHNDARVIGIGSRMTAVEEAKRIVEVFVATRFPAEERHLRRVTQLDTFEQTGHLPQP